MQRTQDAPVARSEVKSHSQYRRDIDGLRALAIGLVLLYHAFPGYVRSGFIGVDVFFVISGYLITGILLDSRTRSGSVRAYVGGFYQRRIRRIFPALIVVLVACAIYGWFRIFPEQYQSLTKYIAGGAGFVSNFLLSADSGYFDAAIEFKPLAHFWSLAIEEQFYLVWPILILLFGRLTRGRHFTLLFLVLATASLAYSIYITPVDPTAAYYSPLSRGWELAAGGILASLHAQGVTARTGTAANWLSVGSFLLIPVGALFLIDEAQFPGWQALLPVLAAAGLIWFGEGSILDRRLLGTRPIVFVGLISYPLYLWHWVVLSFLRIQDSQPSGILLILALGLSFLLATATYFFIERPIKRVPLARASIGLLMAMVLVLTFALTANFLKLSGVKLTPTQEALSQAYDPRPDYRFGSCFLDSATHTAADFAPECAPAPTDGRPRLLLWGDSLTAQLYPGLASLGDGLGYAIAQRTATSCPAAGDDRYADRGNCNEINSSDREWIERNRPSAVVLDARWPDEDAEREMQLTAIVKFLKANGVRTIVIVGPAPDWEPDLRELLIRESQPNSGIPERMTPPEPTWSATQARDVSLSALAQKLGVEYLSLVGLLCSGDQCLIRVSDTIPSGLITSDHDHLTAQASEYVFEHYMVPRPPAD